MPIQAESKCYQYFLLQLHNILEKGEKVEDTEDTSEKTTSI